MEQGLLWGCQGRAEQLGSVPPPFQEQDARHQGGIKHLPADEGGPRAGQDVALLWRMGEQPSYGAAGAGADELEGLTWDPGP